MHPSQRSQEYSPSRPVETRAALAQLWQAASQPTEALSHIRLTGAEPVLPSSFAVGTAAQASIAASALAAAELWRLSQALDHAAGYLMAFGAITALARRCTEGGSWHARVSLAQTGKWLRQLGRIQPISAGRECLTSAKSDGSATAA